MVEDFPAKYQEYMAVVQEREFQSQLRSKIMEARRIASLRAKVNFYTLSFFIAREASFLVCLMARIFATYYIYIYICFRPYVVP